MTNVDPSDLTLWPTIRHLFPLWRAQWRLVSVGLACALVFTLLSLTIPILVQRTIDDAIDGGDRSLLVPYLAAIVAVASLRFVVNFTRRYATARIGITVEARLRSMLYEGYLRYPRAFYDRHATGEVISRATNDIYPVRYFIGWGVVQAIQSVMMLIGAAIVLTVVNWQLALTAAVAMPPIAVLTYFFAHRVFPISREVQRKKGHLTEASDEAVSGSRWCRRSAARTTCATASRTGRRPCGTRRCARHRSRRVSSPASSSSPTSGSRRCSSVAARRLPRTCDRPVHALHHAAPPARVAARGARLDHQRRPARDRGGVAELRVARRDRVAPEPEQPASLPEGRFPYARERPLRVLDGWRGALRHRPRRGAGRDRRGVRADQRRKTSLLGFLPRFYDPTEGRVSSAGSTRGTSPLRSCGGRSRLTQKAVLFSMPLATTCSQPGPTRTGPTSSCVRSGGGRRVRRVLSRAKRAAPDDPTVLRR